METTDVIIAEDEELIREAFRSLVSSLDGFRVVADVGDGRRAVEETDRLVPGIVLMDLAMPGMDGVAATREIKARRPGVKILALTAMTDEAHISEALAAGVDGYVLKNASGEELALAMAALLRGRKFMCGGLMDRIIDGYLKGIEYRSFDGLAHLSPRENQVLDRIARGRLNKQIAWELGISIKTVEKHRANLKRKLGAASTAELIAAYMGRDPNEA